MNLFDSEMSPDESAALLAGYRVGDMPVSADPVAHLRNVLEEFLVPADIVRAVAALVEDRERLKALAAMAAAVREAQKRYFRTRTDTALQESKELERRLDQILANP
jgi:histidinol-phosphate/aromatic aminotransferase/cobyric acid decarboxylase-like protein